MSLAKWVRQLMFELHIRQMDRRAMQQQRELDLKQRELELAEACAKASAEARIKGHAEGHAEEKYAIAKKMKDAGRPLAEVAEITGLSADTVEKL
jgi:predicted transposase/invertase (TIGR01784 family)